VINTIPKAIQAALALSVMHVHERGVLEEVEGVEHV
jgi:hypothetical protein